MKTTLITFAAALMIAGPSFAEREDNIYTGQTSAGDVAAAIAHFAASEQGDGANRRADDAEMGVVVSTSNADNVAFAKAKLSNGERGDN